MSTRKPTGSCVRKSYVGSCRASAPLLCLVGVLLEDDAEGTGVPEAALATLRAQAPLAAPAPRGAKDAEPGAQKRKEQANLVLAVGSAVRHWPVLADALKLQSLSTAGAFEEVPNLSALIITSQTNAKSTKVCVLMTQDSQLCRCAPSPQSTVARRDRLLPRSQTKAGPCHGHAWTSGDLG